MLRIRLICLVTEDLNPDINDPMDFDWRPDGLFSELVLPYVVFAFIILTFIILAFVILTFIILAFVVGAFIVGAFGRTPLRGE